MTGYADCNRPLFNKIEEILRKFFGIENVINPAKLPPEWTYEQWMEKDLNDVANNTDVIVLLPGWEKSKGARAEMKIALEKDLEIVTLNELNHQIFLMPNCN